MKYFVLLFFCLGIISCSTSNKNKYQGDAPDLSEREYNKLLDQFSRSEEKYDGFDNLYNLTATMLNTKVYSALIDRQRYNKQLSTQDSQQLRERAFRQMATETHFFISYFSPQKSLRHLDRGDALWKIYLERDGRRFEASVVKYPGVKYDTQSLFPFHTRWSRGYLVKFKVPTSAVENSTSKLIMSSSAGKVALDFPPVN